VLKSASTERGCARIARQEKKKLRPKFKFLFSAQTDNNAHGPPPAMASSEISSSVLRCNACWKSVTDGKAYKT